MVTRISLVSVALAMSLFLVGCAESVVTPSASPTPSETAGPPPVYLPEGDAQDNKAYFDWVLAPVANADQKRPSRALVNALRTAGFDKKFMQVTPDLSKTQLPADSVIVAVRIDRSCLIGQRDKTGDYYSTIEPALKTGGCLIGTTEKIDW
jgi:hypothetical protein